jgi:hybrid cluster-associated redox disulfide protein
MNPLLSPEITVKELLDRYPHLLQLFMDLGLLCAGCPAEAFHSLNDVAKEYGYDLNKLIHHFQLSIEFKSIF